MYIKNYECTLCHKLFPADSDLFTCPSCGEKGILEIHFDYPALKKILTPEYFSRNTDYSMWRYLPLMSLEGNHHEETLHVGWTPLYRSVSLEKQLGIKALYFKDDGLNPTASLKDRASAVAVLKAIESDKNVICCASTGNAASSLAGNAARMGLKSVIFVPKRAPEGKVAQLMCFGATVISVDGDYKDAFSLSKKAIEHYGWYNRNAAINPHLVEGKKTVSLEIAEQMHFKTPDWVAVSVGDGCTVAGVYKGFYDFYQLGLIDHIPRILAVQSAECAPFVEADLKNRPLEECEELSIADSISVGIPRNPNKVLHAVKASRGKWIAVHDQEILSAMKTLGSQEGLFGEPAGVTGYAGLEKAIKEEIIRKDETVVVIITGNGLKDPLNAVKAAGSPIRMKPDLTEFIHYINQHKEVR